MAFGISGRNWLRLFALAIALYIALLPLWYYSLGAISMVAGTCANWVYTLFDGRVTINPRPKGIQLAFNGSLQLNGLRMDLITYGWPMLVALVIVTRSNSLAAKVKALAIGCLVMFVLTVCALLAWVRMTTFQLEHPAAPVSNDSSFLFLAFHGYAFSQPVVAVLIWLTLMMLGLLNERSKRDRSVGTVARNAACLCGSGRKYKRCCGA